MNTEQSTNIEKTTSSEVEVDIVIDDGYVMPEDIVEVDTLLKGVAEESNKINKSTGEKSMKLQREEAQRRRLVIEESRRYFDKKKTALVDFVEESLEGLTKNQTIKVKRKLSGRNGEWVKKNISSVIRKVVEDGLKSKRKLIKESRSESRTLIVESKGVDSNRKVNRPKSKGMSLVEESISHKKHLNENVIEESVIVKNNDDYSKAGDFM
jgi:hypothetical protein